MSERAPLLDNPTRGFGHSVSVKEKFRKVVFESYVNILLIFVPLGILSGVLGWGATVTFSINFLAIVPLAALLSFATEELAAKVGETIGGLLNATFGNAVELIVSVIALAKGEIRIVQASMLGSILSNLLLVLGCCFIAGGFNRIQQSFNQTVAQTMASLMSLACSALIIPAAFHASTGQSSDEKGVLNLSRIASVILLLIYLLYLVFQLRTHAAYFEGQSEEIESTAHEHESQEDTVLEPWEAIGLLVLVTVLVSFCADYLVDSIDSLVASTGMSKTFIGLILLPIVGNAAEHVTAVIVAMKDKMDLAIGVAVGSSMQIALFLTPFLVVMGWIIGQPMSLYFSTFETAVLFVAVFVSNYLVLDGESNWLEGVMLIGLYLISAIAFFYLPDAH